MNVYSSKIRRPHQSISNGNARLFCRSSPTKVRSCAVLHKTTPPERRLHRTMLAERAC